MACSTQERMRLKFLNVEVDNEIRHSPTSLAALLDVEVDKEIRHSPSSLAALFRRLHQASAGTQLTELWIRSSKFLESASRLC